MDAILFARQARITSIYWRHETAGHLGSEPRHFRASTRSCSERSAGPGGEKRKPPKVR